MLRVRISRPAGGTVIARSRGSMSAYVLNGTYRSDDDPQVLVNVMVRGQSYAASVDVAARRWQATIALDCPSRVMLRATMHARVRDAAGQWSIRTLRSPWLLLVVRDPQDDPAYLIHGSVVDVRDLPLPDLTVRALDVDPRSRADALGESVSDDDGAVAFVFRESAFAESAAEGGPDVLLQVWRGGTQLPAQLVGRRGNLIFAAAIDEPPFVLRVTGVTGVALGREIRAKWRALGGSRGFLGRPNGDEAAVPGSPSARVAHFAGGSICWTPDFGAKVIYGLIRERWRALGAEASALGLPVTDEIDDPVAPGARASVFEHGVVRWRPGQTAASDGPHDFARLHGAMRAQVLARFFAIGKNGRRNLPSTYHHLAAPVPASSDAATRHAADLARWRIVAHNSENPLLFGVNLVAMLAVEQNAGNQESRAALSDWLQTLRSLSTWANTGPEGEGRLPQRWDAGTFLDAENERHGFLALDSGYAGSLRASDPHHHARRSAETLTALLGPRAAAADRERYEHYATRFRVWELSMDELVGLVTSYWLIAKLSTDTVLTAEVRRQSKRVGNYLADHGYLLVRPTGGFSWRGAAEMLPAMEHPISRALTAAAGGGIDFVARASMERVLELAGHWEQLKGPIAGWRTLAWVATLSAVSTSPVARAIGLVANDFTSIFGGQTLSPDTLGAAGALYLHRDVFDIHDRGGQDAGPALALLLRACGDKPRVFRNLTAAIAALGDLAGRQKSWAAAFPGTLCLTGLDDSDATVRSAFATWLALRQAIPRLETKGVGSRTLWVAAVAALLADNDPRAEQRLVELLDRAVVELFRDCYFDPVLPVGAHQLVENGPFEPHEYALMPYFLYGLNPSAPYGVLDFLAAHALASWHARRRADRGAPVTAARYPAPLTAATMASWPTPAVPAHCLPAFGPGGIPIESIHGASPTPAQLSNGVPLAFGSVPRRRATPAPWPAATQLLCDVTVIVPAMTGGEVATGVTLHPGLEYSIEARGTIWAGRLLDPQHGPEGLERPVLDARWPLHVGLDPAANAFCLLGRLNGWFRIGDRRSRRRWCFPEPRALFLRINDGEKVSGSGQYTARVRVWGPASGSWDPPVYRAPQSLDDGATLVTVDPRDLIEVSVERGVARAGTVVFRLVTSGSVTAPKELVTLGVAPARRIRVDGTTRSGEFTLNAAELGTGSLTLHRQSGLAMQQVRLLGALAAVPLEASVTLNWVLD